MFERLHWTNLHGKPVHAFSYLIDKAHSKYTMNYGMFLKRYKDSFLFTTAELPEIIGNRFGISCRYLIRSWCSYLPL